MNSKLILVIGVAIVILDCLDSCGATTPLQAIEKRDDREPPLNRKLANRNTPRARLPANLIPNHYELEIMPIIDTEEPPPPGLELNTARGTVTITVTCVQVTRDIYLHSWNLTNITSTEVVLKGTTTPLPHAESSDSDNDFLILSLEDVDLTEGEEYEIKIQFTSPVSTDRVDGLYLSSYTYPGSATPSVLATTQFAANAARYCFPCFDEPGLKSTFDISIARLEKYSSISNSEIIGTEDDYIPGTDWKLDHFNTTVKMSTYLVAFIVSEYSYAEAEMTLPGGQPVKIYAPPHMIERGGGEYAANTSAKVMTFFEDYFQMEYKMHKMDSAVIPDFYFGAMENWGLITYRELLLMHYAGETTETERARITSIVAHESAHQWFGNVITSQWWNHIWLNEGFATFLSFIGSNATNDEFETLKSFLNDPVQYSMTFDVTPDTSHPIRNEDSIGAPLYDRINYDKGASLIRMMYGFLSPVTVKSSLQIFLKEWEFQGVEQDNLFSILNEQAHLDNVIPEDLTVKDIMDTWTRQSGYPLVRVSKFSEDAIQISQERFKYGLPPGDLNENDLWYIPISIASELDNDFSNHTPEFWLGKKTALKIYPHNVSTWIMLNADATGYYRVHYDSHLLSLIKDVLDNSVNVISPASRSQLLDDYFTMAFHDFVTIERALELTTYLHQETEPIVWHTVFTNLQRTVNMLERSDGFGSFRNYILPKIEAAILKIGFEQPSEQKGRIVMYRLQLLDWACKLELDSCLNMSSSLFSEWEVNPDINPIPIDLQPVVYCSAVGSGVPAFEFALKRYHNTTTTTKQKQLLLNALACTNEVYLLQTLLEENLNDTSEFRLMERLTLIERIFLNSLGRPLTIQFIRTYFSAILDKFGNVKLFEGLFNSFGQYCNTDLELTQIQDFMEQYKDLLVGVEKTLQSAVVAIRNNINWVKSYYGPMHDWFTAQTMQITIL